MTIVAVESIPKAEKASYKFDTDTVLDLFVNSSAKIVKVTCDPTEYLHNVSLYNVLRRHIISKKRPIEIHMVNGEVYLEKIV